MNILITGASGGMGRGIMQSLEDNGSTFILHSHDENSVAKLKTQTSKLNGKFHYLVSDLTTQAGIDDLLNQTIGLGGADIVIHSVSLPTTLASLGDKSWDNFEAHLNIQVKSLFQILQKLSPGMRERNFGRIIALASEYTISRPPPKLADYVTSKYALLGLIKVVAVELGPFGITANCISSGLAETSLTSHLPDKLKQLVAQQTPLKKLTTPQDIGAMVKFLSSPGAGMITGENILVNGGYVMR